MLFVLLLIGSTAYLHRVPGLFGDEASEGQNVYELLHIKPLTVQGERSYIGPLVDYARVPFVAAFGYTALSLRLLMLVVSLITFALAATVFRRLFGTYASYWALAFVFFCPTYLLKQRLGWAITLFPFFAMLTLFFATGTARHKKILTGLAAGLGLHNYLAFLPTLAGIGTGLLLSVRPAQLRQRAYRRDVFQWWLGLLAFWAAFGTQFAVMQLWQEDQGNPAEVISQIGRRLEGLPSLLPMILSGSSYVARYTGTEFSPQFSWYATILLALLALVPLVWSTYKKNSWRWAAGLAAHLTLLLVMIDRFTLRYFVVFVLGIWALAGLGAAALLTKLPSRWHRYFTYLPVATAVLLLLWTNHVALQPYLKTGGSTAEFSLGNRTDTAAHFADSRPLLDCVRDGEPVFSKDAHLYNMLLYLNHEYPDLVVPEDTHEAHWLVEFRKPGKPPGQKCPELEHYRVVKRK